MSFVSSNNCQQSNKPPFLNGCSLTRRIYQTSIPPGKLSVPSPLTFFDSRGMRNTWVSFSECMTLERGCIRGNSQSVSLNWYIQVPKFAEAFSSLEGGGGGGRFTFMQHTTHWFLRRSQLHTLPLNVIKTFWLVLKLFVWETFTNWIFWAIYDLNDLVRASFAIQLYLNLNSHKLFNNCYEMIISFWATGNCILNAKVTNL